MFVALIDRPDVLGMEALICDAYIGNRAERLWQCLHEKFYGLPERLAGPLYVRRPRGQTTGCQASRRQPVRPGPSRPRLPSARRLAPPGGRDKPTADDRRNRLLSHLDRGQGQCRQPAARYASRGGLAVVFDFDHAGIHCSSLPATTDTGSEFTASVGRSLRDFHCRVRIGDGADNREIFTLALEALDYRDHEHLILIRDPSGLPAALFRDLGESGVTSIISSTIGRCSIPARRQRQRGFQGSEALR